jgi:hypothetical protein
MKLLIMQFSPNSYFICSTNIKQNRKRLQVGWPRFDSLQKQEIFSFLHSVQTDSGAHLVAYPTGTGASFSGGKADGE